MHHFDVAIIGAGTGGTVAAAMLGKAGYRTALIDPAERFAPEFRCEKLEPAHLDPLMKAGLLSDIIPVGRKYDTIWIARHGRLVEKKVRLEYGMDYSTFVNAMRDMVPGSVERVLDKVVAVQGGKTESRVALAGGREITARLVIVATGLHGDLLASLGVKRRVVSPCHSISIGFDVAPRGRANFDFDAMTYFGESPRDRVAYLTIFPFSDRMRANLFVYRDKGDPWLGAFRENPEPVLHETLPNLRAISGDFGVTEKPRMRPVDLVNAEGIEQDGIVFIGDAFSTACPVSGTGASKALVDAQRLCSVYVPEWLTDGDLSSARLSAFYRDEEKVASDQHSRGVSLFAKRFTTEPGVIWSGLRWARFAGAIGRDLARHIPAFRRHEMGASLQWQS